MRVLFFTGSPAMYMMPPPLGMSQVNCGPDWPDRVVNGTVVSLRTPVGAYDVQPFVKRLPATQRPDVVVCLVDAARRNLPANLGSFRGPKVLLVADTHHLRAPIAGMLQYAGSEPYDRIIILYDRHHLKFFRSAGLKNLFWFPGLSFPHSDEQVAHARKSWEERTKQIAFVGQTGGLHPRRARLVEALARVGSPVCVKQIPQPAALELYGSSAIGLNVSLNGDLNLRVFEILASGAMLLTDQLASDSGMDELWTSRQLVRYKSEHELVDLVAHHLKHPSEAATVAREGATWFDSLFSEKKRRLAFERIVFDGVSVPEFVLPTVGAKTWFAGAPRQRDSAIKIYERVQELHRRQETVTVAIDVAASKDVAEMFTTLPRVLVASCFDRPSDLAVISGCNLDRVSQGLAARVWVVDAAQSSVAMALSASGLQPIDRDLAFFARDPREIEDAKLIHAACWTHLSVGDYAHALDLARVTLAKDPKDVDALVTMADLAVEARNESLAIRLVRTAEQVAPADERVIELKQQLTRFPRSSQLPTRLLNRGRQLVANGEWAAAAAVVGKALASENPPGGQLLLGQIMIACGNYKAASAALLKAVGEGESTELWNLLGSLALKTEKPSDAADAFRKALQLDTSSVAGWHGLADAAEACGDWPAEEEAVRRLLRLAPSDPRTLLHLGHVQKRQGKMSEALGSYCRAVGAGCCTTERIRVGKPRVVFLVQHGPSWLCTESVWQAFKADPTWETVIVALPYQHPLYNRAQDDTNEIFGFLRERAIPHVRWDQFSLRPGCADVMFVQNPYDITRPPGWRVPELLRSVPRLAYVPYGIEIGGGQTNAGNQFNQLIQQVAWAVFARSDRHRAMFARHCAAGNAHVYVSGHPKMDAQRALAHVRDRELMEFANGRRTVLWNPQFDVRPNGTPFGGGFSTFLRWYDFMVGEFARRPNMVFIIRPHPLFFGTMQARGILTTEQIREWLDRCAAAGNIHIDRRASYLPAFAAADAMLSDASSFLLEYAGTGKPLLYLHNPFGPSLNADGEFVTQFCRTAETEDAIQSFLDDAAAGRDSLGDKRRAAYREYMHIPASGAGQTIKEIICSRLVAEHGGCADFNFAGERAIPRFGEGLDIPAGSTSDCTRALNN